MTGFERVAPLALAIMLGFCIVATDARQSPETASLKVTKIEFPGLSLITPQQAAEACGLRVGQSIQIRDLQTATDQMMTSGLFKRVHYHYQYQDGLVEVTFEVEEEKWGTPIIFDNFVWASDEDLAAAIRRKFPEFRDAAPDSAGVLNAIKEILQKSMEEKKIAGQVEYISQMDQAGHNKVNVFVAKGPDTHMCELQFPGASRERLAELNAAAKSFIGQEYSRSALQFFARTVLVEIYRKYGYLRASFDKPGATLGGEGKCKGGVLVKLAATEGPVYKWDKASWTGNHAFSEQELSTMLGMNSGEAANGQKIDKGLKAIQERYGKKGYLAARVVPAADFNDDAHAVSYRCSVDEGPQYRMGKLIVMGVSDSEAGKVKERWALQEGAVLDLEYISDFPNRITKGKVSGVQLRDCEISFKLDKQRAVADIVLTIHK
jgi:outer membrane protein assembly factor BamA